MDEKIEKMLTEELEKKMKEVQVSGIIAGGKAACTNILEIIEKAESDSKAITEIKKFCTASINLDKARKLVAKKKAEEE